MLVTSVTRAEQPLVGKLVLDLKAWRSEAAKDPNFVTVNGAAMTLNPKERDDAIEWAAGMLKDFSVDIRADGTFIMTLGIGEVSGTWKTDGERLIATPTRTKSNCASLDLQAKTFWLVREPNGVRYGYDEHRNHTLPLTGAAG